MTGSMLRVGMWNTGRKLVAELLAEVVVERRLNMLVLIERADPLTALLEILGKKTGTPWFLPWSACDRITILTHFPDPFVGVVVESNKFTIRRIYLPGLPDLLFVCAHLRSRLRQSERSQVFATRDLVTAILEAERRVGHRRTILAGDFNMDPYDDGMLGAGALHGMMSRRTALLGSRIIDEQKYLMFYNPMWGFLGDRTPGPPGTYRYWTSEHICREWHVFDQVLVRPDLVHAFPLEQLQILDSIGSSSLLSRAGVPTPSDHLPVVFEISEP
jgi:hypothetical protein